MQLIDSIREFFRRRIFKATQESVRAAMKEVSRRQAEMVYHSSLAQYFHNEAAKITPSEDWWGYADHMQKWSDHVDEGKVEERKWSAAEAKLSAEHVRFTKLTKS